MPGGSAARSRAAASSGDWPTVTGSANPWPCTEASRTEAVFGGQVEAGIDFLLGRRVMTGLRFAYDLMSDFQQPIGGCRNYSGPEFTIGLGFLIGGGP